MSKFTSKQWLLKEQPGDNFNVFDTFELKSTEISAGDLKDDQLLVKTKYLSNDPAQRTWISKHFPEGRLYRTPIKAGEVMDSGAIAEVVESKSDKYKKGDLVQASVGWTEYKIIDASKVMAKVSIEATDAMALGLTALTAYFGLLRIGSATSKDQTIVVSGAAGATGSNVCQIAKNVLGIKTVIGIAGSDEKCEMIKKDAGCDIALNYKSKSFKQDFEKATPDYVDVFYDNVGGDILDMVMQRMKDHGRVVACGAISAYDDNTKPALGTSAWAQIIFSKLRVQGFIVGQFMEDFGKATQELQGWVKDGKLKPLKNVWEASFDEVPEGMQKLLKGENTGKLITKLK